jgi:hypothetical protein
MIRWGAGHALLGQSVAAVSAAALVGGRLPVQGAGTLDCQLLLRFRLLHCTRH